MIDISGIFKAISDVFTKFVWPVLIYMAGKKDAQNEATAKEADALAQDVAIGDRVDNLVDLDGMRETLNKRP